METKKPRPSFGDDSGSRSDPGPSALRRLTSSPTGRLSLRRSRRSSCSTSDSSIDARTPLSCVTRETSRDECALHRFIVWAAVKRNACDKMTPSERLECPLLRCRKRFPNHELMLKHLYTCYELTTGEYWCYDCGRAEKFTDGKCKRCLGHPAKRRKILSMAKNFFSQLGHRSRRASPPGLDVGDDVPMPPPPSYDSLQIHPDEVELFSTEILEIDSTEIPVTSVPEVIVQPQPTLTARIVEPLPVASLDRAELESISTLPEVFLDWERGPEHLADDAMADRCQTGSPERPSLQLDTHDLDQYRAKRRSKILAPSSSVRSTASTNSTTSTASSGKSPMSAWSGAWTAGSGIDTTLTSPTSDLNSPGGLFHSNSLRFSKSNEDGGRKDASDMDGVLHDMFFELPADFPVTDALPQSFADNLCSDNGFFSFDSGASTDISITSNTAFTEETVNPLDLPDTASQEPTARCVEASSFVGSAWDTLQAHVTSSISKLRNFTGNDFASQLRNMSPKMIATTGLATLRALLCGQTPTSPIDILCFVHVAYSLSLVIHEQDTQTRAKDLFCQAMAYSSNFLAENRAAYSDVAAAIWQPGDITDTQLQDIMLSYHSTSVSRSPSPKGKECDSNPAILKLDPLISVAQYFLDELEFSALPHNNSPSLEVFTSDLWSYHLKDDKMRTPPSSRSPLTITLSYILKVLSQKFCGVRDLRSRLKDIQDRIDDGYISSVRRAELELFQAGKSCMPAKLYFDDFVPSVRQQCGPLYHQQIPGSTPRTTYYGFGISLMESIIISLSQDNTVPTGGSSEDPQMLDEFFQSLNTESYDGDFDSLLQGENFTFSNPVMAATTTINPSTLSESNPGLTAQPQDKRGQFTFAGQESVPRTESMPGASNSPSSQPSTSTKVEANDCCEICGYRPKGDPQWFKGSMAKHKKLQHATSPPKIYKCPYPGCTSQYKNRPDNLRQHQLDKNHFVDEGERRPSKRKKTEV